MAAAHEQQQAGAASYSAQQQQAFSADELTDVLRRHFNLDAFRPLQLEAVQATLAGRDSLVVLPTWAKFEGFQASASCSSSSSAAAPQPMPRICSKSSAEGRRETSNDAKPDEVSRQSRRKILFNSGKIALLHAFPSGAYVKHQAAAHRAARARAA